MKVLKCFLLVFYITLIAFIPTFVSASEELTRIKVGTTADFPPFESINPETNEIVGFDVDLMNAIAKEIGASVEYINVPWREIFIDLDNDRYDAIISAVTITDERRYKYDFTDPYITVKVENSEINSNNIEDYGIVVNKGNKKVLDLINRGLREVVRKNGVEELKNKWGIR